MNEIECETCIKRKTKYCPSSRECYETTLKPHYQNRIMLFEENKKLRQLLKQKEDIINKLTTYIPKEKNKNVNEVGVR